MERRFEARLQEMMAQAEVSPDLLRELMPRLTEFVQPFVADRLTPEQIRHTTEYLLGLVSKLERKTGEGIAYLHDQNRQGLQKFIGYQSWEHQPMLLTLARQVGQELGQADGVIVFDPSAFPKKGTKSVGVAKQWCGRLGKIENCQVGIFMGYVTRKEHALVNVRLYLPEEWTGDRARCREAGVPQTVPFRTRHQQALEMLNECGADLPHIGIAGDDEMGRPSGFRRDLRDRGERYLLDVPSNALIRDLEAPPPEYSGRGPHPKIPITRLDHWISMLPEEAWRAIEVRDGEKGPLVVEAVKRRVQARTETGGTGPEEVLYVRRERQADQTYKYSYSLSNASSDVPLKELARVNTAAHRIEECLKRCKSEAGLGDYQVRTWQAWHHHVTLALLAAWFLTQELRRGKTQTPALTFPQLRQLIGGVIEIYLRTNDPATLCRRSTRWLQRNEQARFYRYHSRNILPPLRNRLRT